MWKLLQTVNKNQIISIPVLMVSGFTSGIFINAAPLKQMTVIGLTLGSLATPFHVRALVGASLEVDIAAVMKPIAISSVVRIKMIDIDKNREIAFRLGIQSIPTIIIYREGREVKRFIGLQTGDTLCNALQETL